MFPPLPITQQAVAQIGQGEVLGENETVQQAVAQAESGITPQLVAQIVSIPSAREQLPQDALDKIVEELEANK